MMGSIKHTQEIYLSTCNLHKQARDLMPSHGNSYLLGFHAGSDTDCLISGKLLNFSVTRRVSILTSILRDSKVAFGKCF